MRSVLSRPPVDRTTIASMPFAPVAVAVTPWMRAVVAAICARVVSEDPSVPASTLPDVSTSHTRSPGPAS